MTAELSAALAAMSPWEVLAAALAIAYLLLAARERIACWGCALVSTAIYTVLFWNVSLLMESALNVYYLLMAIYGWYQWRRGGRGGNREIDHDLTNGGHGGAKRRHRRHPNDPSYWRRNLRP